MILPRVNPGQRALALGRTSSGKTTGAVWLMSRSPGRWLALNVKYDDLITQTGPDVDMDVGKVIDAHKRHRVIVIHPAVFEQQVLDDFVFELGESRHATGLLVDELLYLSKGNGQAGPGLMGWLSRGRSRQQSFIGASQRPSNITQYAYTESDYFMLYDLKLKKDWQKIYDFTGRSDLERERKKHFFGWYDVGLDKRTEFAPVPYKDLTRRFK